MPWIRRELSCIAHTYILHACCKSYLLSRLSSSRALSLHSSRTGHYVAFLILVAISWCLHEYRRQILARLHHYVPLRWTRTHFFESPLFKLRHHVPIPIFGLSKLTIQAPLRYQAAIVLGLVCLNTIPLLCSYRILPGTRDAL
jgi:hypothetical protein